MAVNRKNPAVGYRKPPKSGQFQKGRSGNPRGRPAGTLSMSAVFEKVLNEKVTLPGSGGRNQRITKREIIAKQLVNKAAQGDPRTLQQLLTALRHMERESSSAPAATNWAFIEDDEKVIEQVVIRIRQSATDET